MPSENPQRETKFETPQQQAATIVEALDRLFLDVAATREIDGKTPPPERVMALISDSRSLAEGISNGAITVSQPRMATNLVAVADELDKRGHHPLASTFTNVVREISMMGIAAEHCSLGRTRIGPQKP